MVANLLKVKKEPFGVLFCGWWYLVNLILYSVIKVRKLYKVVDFLDNMQYDGSNNKCVR